MQTTINILDNFEKKGILLWSENGKLKYKASKETMTPDVMAELKANKEAILQTLEEREQNSKFVIDRTNRYEPFPLTDVQSAYLVGRSKLYDYGGVACHVYLELKYKDLDTSRVLEIWNALARKYDMLHAVINEGGFQQVLKEVPSLEIPEWNLVKKPENKEAFEEFRKQMGNRAYTIGKWPMFGLAVSKHVDYSILHFSIEFLIADWTSIWKLVAEFEGAYFDNVAIEGEEKISFRDYLIAEKKIKESKQYQSEKAYWMERIPNLPESPELPINSIDQVQDAFERKFTRLSPEEWNRVKTRSKQYGLTPTVPVLTAYADVLAKWSRNKDFCINMTVLNRLPLHKDVMEIVGDFTSLSLLEIHNNTKTDFLTRAKTLNAQLFDDIDHRLFSGVEVMREISRQTKKNGISMPIVYTSAIGLSESSKPLRAEFCGGISQTPQTFIDCQVMDGSFGLQVNWDLRAGVFAPDIIDAMFKSFEERLKSLADENADWTLIKNLAIPQKDHEERTTANSTQRQWNVRMLQADFRKNVLANPAKIAVDDGITNFTYRELDLRASALAQALVDNGVKRGDSVPVLMEKSAWQIVSVMGILYAGAVYIPISAAHASGRAQKIMTKSGCKVVLGVSTEEHPEAEGYTLINVDTLAPTEGFTEVSNDPNDVAYVIYTSGSTGEPKGVVITHAGAMNTIDDMNARFHVSSNDNVLGLSQLNFDLSVYDIFGVLGAGGTIYYPPKADYMNPAYWYSLLHEKQITLWNSVPALMKILLNYTESVSNPKLPLEKVFLSGDWIPVDMPGTIQKYAPTAEVICLGGATEASIWSNYHRYDANDGLKILPYGRPLSNQTMYVLDENLEDCPVLVPGQIALGGDGVALGYHFDKERTDKQFVFLPGTTKRVYLTGDFGRYLHGGEIEFLGRRDNQVKIRGHRIELGEIENVLLEFKNVRAAVAIVSADKNEIFAMIEKSGEIDKDGLKNHIDKYLLHYMHPSHIEIVEAMPLSTNGKIDRKAVLSLIESKKVCNKDTHTDSAITPDEEKIAEIWKKALEVNQIGPEENVYDLGANSIMMTQVATSIRTQLKIEMPFDILLKQMLDYPTVRDTANFLFHKEENEVKKDKGDFIRMVHYGNGEIKDGKIRVILPPIFWNPDRFKYIVPTLQAQNEGEVYTFAIDDDEGYFSVKPEDVGTTLAALFTKHILETGAKSVQLIGYCFISSVAIEVAERLEEAGVKVPDLSIIDGTRFGFTSKTIFTRNIFFSEMLAVDLKKWGLDAVECAECFQKILETSKKTEIGKEEIIATADLMKDGSKLKQFLEMNDDEILALCKEYSMNFAHTADDKTLKRLLKLYTHNTSILGFYTPTPYFGNVRYFMAENKEGVFRYFGMFYKEWEELCIGNYELLIIKGNHFSCIDDPTYAKELAQKLSYAHKEAE